MEAETRVLTNEQNKDARSEQDAREVQRPRREFSPRHPRDLQSSPSSTTLHLLTRRGKSGAEGEWGMVDGIELLIIMQSEKRG